MLQTELDSVIVLLIETLQETVVHMSFLELTFRNSILSFFVSFFHLSHSTALVGFL